MSDSQNLDGRAATPSVDGADKYKALPASEIVASQAFRVINHQMDRALAELRWELDAFKRAVDRAFAEPGGVCTRVSYEPGGRNEEPIPCAMYELDRLRETFDMARSLNSQLAGLQRLKLRLLNDYDFTHGDDTEQRLIFSPPADGALERHDEEAADATV